MSNSILVTGGAGFIGSNLCEFLLQNDENVIYCLDNTPATDENTKKILEKLKKYENFHFVAHDVKIPYKSLIKFDYIYHLACPRKDVNKIDTVLTSVIGTKNMLDLANKNNAVILFSSTSGIYGNSLQNHPQTENYNGDVNPIGAKSYYNESKRLAESLMFEYKRIFTTKIKVVRIFNAYGPNMTLNSGKAVSNMIIQALTNKNITIYGSGEQTRSFCYIDDLIDGIVKMMNSNTEFNGPVNLGNPSERTINDLAEKIIELTHTSSKIEYLPLSDDEPEKRKPDITLAQNELAWGYKFLHIYKGLKKTIEYFEKI